MITKEQVETILKEMETTSLERRLQAQLFRVWIVERNYSKISRMTDIPRTTVSKYVKDAINYIELKTKNHQS